MATARATIRPSPQCLCLSSTSTDIYKTRSSISQFPEDRLQFILFLLLLLPISTTALISDLHLMMMMMAEANSAAASSATIQGQKVDRQSAKSGRCATGKQAASQGRQQGGVIKMNKESKRIKKIPQALQVQASPPLIIHSLSPKIIHTHPTNFMRLVQLLTGSSATRLRCDQTNYCSKPNSSLISHQLVDEGEFCKFTPPSPSSFTSSSDVCSNTPEVQSLICTSALDINVEDSIFHASNANSSCTATYIANDEHQIAFMIEQQSQHVNSVSSTIDLNNDAGCNDVAPSMSCDSFCSWDEYETLQTVEAIVSSLPSPGSFSAIFMNELPAHSPTACMQLIDALPAFLDCSS